MSQVLVASFSLLRPGFVDGSIGTGFPLSPLVFSTGAPYSCGG